MEYLFALILGAKISYWMLADFPSVDVENGLRTIQNFDTLTKEEMERFFTKDYAKKTFAITEKLQQFDFSQDEINVMRAFVIFNPGRDKLLILL